MEVEIQRSARSWQKDVVNIKAISNVRWDNLSGGCFIREAHLALYGYIDYQLAASLNIGCSGRHNYGYNQAKVRICKPKNKKDPHYAGYYELKKQAGPKSRGLSACEDKILDILGNKGSMKRNELIGELLSCGVYNRAIISNSLRALVDDIYITVSRDENGAKIYHKI